MCGYIIRVKQAGETLYLFNSRMLVHDSCLARRFVSVPAARRFWKHTAFTAEEMEVLPDGANAAGLDFARAL